MARASYAVFLVHMFYVRTFPGLKTFESPFTYLYQVAERTLMIKMYCKLVMHDTACFQAFLSIAVFASALITAFGVVVIFEMPLVHMEKIFFAKVLREKK